MKAMFDRCASLEEVYISNFDTSSVTDMSQMFTRSGLKSFNFPNSENLQLLTVEEMFTSRNNLEEIDFSNFDCSSAFVFL